MLLLEQDTTRRGRVDKMSYIKLDESNSKEYEIEAICNNNAYAKELDSGHHLPGLHYLISWKGHPEEKNIWEPALAIQHIWRLIITFHKEHLGKLIVTSSLIDFAPPIARPIVKPTLSTK